MAELRDGLNRKVLNIDIRGADSKELTGDLRLVFQKDVFVDNVVGWRDEVQAEVRLYNVAFDKKILSQFVAEARTWLELPLDALGSTFFSGNWRLAADENRRVDLEFQRYYQTPSKTDWFTVDVVLRSELISWSESLQSDYTCLALFVEGLLDWVGLAFNSHRSIGPSPWRSLK